MNPSDPEFSHIVKLDEIGAGTSHHNIQASATERAALALRFDLLSLDLLEATLVLSRSGMNARASGRMSARAVQACIAGGNDVQAVIDAPVEIDFLPELQTTSDAEIELTPDDCDTMFHDGKIIDIGEAVAQTLALALDPYPRSDAASQKLRAAGVKADNEVEAASGPFAALASLKDTLSKQ